MSGDPFWEGRYVEAQDEPLAFMDYEYLSCYSKMKLATILGLTPEQARQLRDLYNSMKKITQDRRFPTQAQG